MADSPTPDIFCQIAAGTLPAHVVWQSERLLAFLDQRPVFKGHTLLVPRAHVENLLDLPADLHAEVLGAAQLIAAALQAGLGAQGSFVAVNNTISQSVPHLHVHLVPRRKGDGLRGFFWPRTKYSSDDEAANYAARLRAALAASDS
ncbi:HIT family protein [Propionibacteriaceae bacterium G57]|uniref:HIT family protein n=1 Tax=Aestuariimicrobium sp. G57 TaxID=3418485 RepID=UPI003DA72C5E